MIAQIIYARERGSLFGRARCDLRLELVTIPGCVLQLLGAM